MCRSGTEKPCLPAGNRREGVQHVAGGSRQPVEPRRHQYVPGSEGGDCLAKRCPIGLGSACHLPAHFSGSSSRQRDDLHGIVRRLHRSFVIFAVNPSHAYTKAFFDERLDITHADTAEREKPRTAFGFS